VSIVATRPQGAARSMVVGVHGSTSNELNLGFLRGNSDFQTLPYIATIIDIKG
jgi:hypothetical protein